ncbi:trichohyalin-like [Tachysurus ichikawai]
MEKEKNQERVELEIREMEEILAEKINKLRMFQIEKERVEQKIPEMATMQEMTEDLEASEPKKEAGEKEGLEKADRKLKRLSIPWLKELRREKITK